MAKKHDADMTQGVVWKQIMNFAVPMMIGLIFQQLYNTVDTIVVGQFVGKEALAAVGSTGTIINMLVSLSAGLSSGAMSGRRGTDHHRHYLPAVRFHHLRRDPAGETDAPDDADAGRRF